MQKIIGQLMPRQRFMGAATAKLYPPQRRAELMRKLGGATKVHIHTRVYDRSPAGAPVIAFEVYAGCFGDETPAQGLRTFAIAPASVSPAFPWSAAGGFTPPDDGYFTLTPTMGLLDILLSISGSGACWAEVEIWYTAEYGS